VILTPVVSGANFEPIRSAASAPAVTLASSRVASFVSFRIWPLFR